MILDNINPNDLFPTETKGPSVLGIIEYHVPYNEIESINMTDDGISFTFNIGKVPMTKIKNGDIQRFVDYVSNKI